MPRKKKELPKINNCKCGSIAFLEEDVMINSDGIAAHGYHVICQDPTCDCVGQFCKKPKDAIDHWNKMIDDIEHV